MFQRKKKGFSLIEVIIALAILVVLSALFAPSLVKHIDEARSAKDAKTAADLTEVIEASLTNDIVYQEITQYIVGKNKNDNLNYSSYVDRNPSTLEAYKENLGANSYRYTDKARVADGVRYLITGKMRGITITFPVTEDRTINYQAGRINEVHRGNYKGDGQNATIILRDASPAMVKFIQSKLGKTLPIDSRTYRASELTVFIYTGSIVTSVETASSPMTVYSQWDGTNLIDVDKFSGTAGGIDSGTGGSGDPEPNPILGPSGSTPSHIVTITLSNGDKIIADRTFENNSWPTIHRVVSDRKISSVGWSVGDTKRVIVHGKTYSVRIIGINQDCEDSITCMFTSSIDSRPINPTDTNLGGWDASKINTWLNKDVYNSLNEHLKNVITPMPIIHNLGNCQTGTATSPNNHLFLLSANEIGLLNKLNNYDQYMDDLTAEGTQTYQYFTDQNNYNTMPANLWLRSADCTNNNSFLMAKRDTICNSVANSNGEILPAFVVSARTDPIVDPTLENNNWETIQSVVCSGRAQSVGWKLGDTKTLVINGQVKKARIIGFDCDGIDTVTFMLTDSIAGRAMNEPTSNQGGWKDSEMRAWLNGEVYDGLTPELKQALYRRTTVYTVGEAPSDTATCSDYLFLLSAQEVGVVTWWFDTTESDPHLTQEGARYPFFDNSQNRDMIANCETFWLRSTAQLGQFVQLDGSLYPCESWYPRAVIPAFVVGLHY